MPFVLDQIHQRRLVSYSALAGLLLVLLGPARGQNPGTVRQTPLTVARPVRISELQASALIRYARLRFGPVSCLARKLDNLATLRRIRRFGSV